VARERAAAEEELARLATTLRVVGDDVGDTLTLLEGVRQAGGEAAVPTAGALRQALDELQSSPAGVPIEERLRQVRVVQSWLATVRAQLETLTAVPPEVLIRPFRSVTHSLVGEQISAFDFYVPSVLMLLLQHLGVTFSALSLVRERQLGSIELFGVAPVSGGEVLAGKCVAYLLLGAGVALVLTVALRTALDIPFAGSGVDVALGMVAVLLASLGIGFLISLVSATDSQAVQLSMLALLASFFFSGFFLSLERLAGPASFLGAFLPATQGIALARDVMLRGRPLPLGDVGQLVAIAAVTLTFTWYRFGRQLRLG
jgi:ABC-2 type transport system permease protein